MTTENMLEGPEIKRVADCLTDAITDRPITSAFFAFTHLKPYESKLTSQRVTAVIPRGQAILIRFENQLSIYTHSQLYGKWVVTKTHCYPPTTRQLRLALHNQQYSALLYSSSEIEVLNDRDLNTHSFLSRLGPDVLNQPVTIDQIRARFRFESYRRRSLASLLIDQHFLAGLGNYLRSEVLFAARVHPYLRPIDCNDEQLTCLAQAAITIPRRAYENHGITIALQQWEILRQEQDLRARYYVFNRDQQPCWLCSTPIVKETSAGRRYYFCPNCQSLPLE